MLDLIITFCISILTILSVICVCTFYYCCRRYVFNRPNNKSTLPYTESPTDFVAKKTSMVKRKRTSQPTKIHKRTSSYNLQPAGASPPNSQAASVYSNAQASGVHNLQLLPVVAPSTPLDRGSITAEMFTGQTDANLKKEIILYKAPSFVE